MIKGNGMNAVCFDEESKLTCFLETNHIPKQLYIYMFIDKLSKKEDNKIFLFKT
jgi:hypothetical protein